MINESTTSRLAIAIAEAICVHGRNTKIVGNTKEAIVSTNYHDCDRDGICKPGIDCLRLIYIVNGKIVIDIDSCEPKEKFYKVYNVYRHLIESHSSFYKEYDENTIMKKAMIDSKFLAEIVLAALKNEKFEHARKHLNLLHEKYVFHKTCISLDRISQFEDKLSEINHNNRIKSLKKGETLQEKIIDLPSPVDDDVCKAKLNIKELKKFLMKFYKIK